MTDLSVIENKLSSIKRYLSILDNFKNYSRDTLENDLVIRGAVERYLYLVSQSAIDLAEAVISYKKLRKPTTMSESFYILGEGKFIDNTLVQKMAKLVGFRNIMAHDYEKVDYNIVYDILQFRLNNIEEFLDSVEKILKK
jgi:uncharacterized protein YutE (UPF0331/DUF86 family)